MTGWEYRVYVVNGFEPVKLQEKLNMLGAAGWEIGPSDMENGVLIFKRPAASKS